MTELHFGVQNYFLQKLQRHSNSLCVLEEFCYLFVLLKTYFKGFDSWHDDEHCKVFVIYHAADTMDQVAVIVNAATTAVIRVIDVQ